jgi:alpha-1,3/alpha-1,6-mannosyltransferase
MVTTGMADIILVNSKFTRKIFYDTFDKLKNTEIGVLYPSLNTEVFDKLMSHLATGNEKPKYTGTKEKDALIDENLKEMLKANNKKFIFLSINRYERKKDLGLALKAMHELKEKVDRTKFNECHLVMAGGYDWRVNENVDHYEELRQMANSFGIDENVTFLRSISDQQKVDLLQGSVRWEKRVIFCPHEGFLREPNCLR